MFISVLVFNFTGINAYAAEEVIATQEQENKTEDSNISTETGTGNNTDTNTVTSTATTTATTTDTSKEASTVTSTKASTETTKTVATKTSTKATVKKAKKVKAVTKKYTAAELRLLTAIIYCEAKSEKYNGKLAVGIVVMNRVKSNRYPNSVKSVVYQKYQFSPVTNGTLRKALAEYDKGKFTSTMEKDCIKAAKAALNGTTSITVNGKKKNFSKYLSFSCSTRGYTYKLGNHQFK